MKRSLSVNRVIDRFFGGGFFSPNRRMPTIIFLLHPSTDPIIPTLVAAGYACVAFDTTGAGRSPYTGIEQSVASLADDVEALLAHLKVHRAIIVGHSMGGMVAAELTSRSGRIEKTQSNNEDQPLQQHEQQQLQQQDVQDDQLKPQERNQPGGVDNHGGETNHVPQQQQQQREQEQNPEHLQRQRPRWSGQIAATVWIGPVLPSAGVADVFRKRIERVEAEGMEAMANTIPLAATAPSASPLVHAFIRELLLGQTAPGYVSNCRVIAGAAVAETASSSSSSPPSLSPCSLPSWYHRVACPVLLLAGKEDNSVPLANCETIFASLDERVRRKSSMVVLENCGHWHVLERPDAVANEMLGFLKKTLSTTA